MTLHLKTIEDFREAKKKYSNKSNCSWEEYMWDFFESETYYDTEKDYFFSGEKQSKALQKAVDELILN